MNPSSIMRWDGRIRADARYLPIASESIQCVVTSPPYWGLRDYKQDGQIGLEKTPREYLNNIREVAFEIWRVLRKDGTFWLNLGDSYARMQEGNVPQTKNLAVQPPSMAGRAKHAGLKAKDLCGIPWRVAFALQEDGWYLRSDIIWAKKNCMPESVRDRPTRSHEYIFLLTKSERYYYDADAISEPCDPKNSRDTTTTRRYAGQQPDSGFKNGRHFERRNKRTVWNLGTQPYPEAHYATFPEEIPELCIKAGSRPGDLVLDPFFGSGTVGRVADRLSRRWIGCDLGYQDLQQKRMNNIQRELVIP